MALRLRRRAIVNRLAAWLAKKSSLRSRPEGFARITHISYEEKLLNLQGKNHGCACFP